MNHHPKSIFVTVGTTLFEALIESVTTETALQWISSRGYTRLVIQYGKGKRPDIDDQTVILQSQLSSSSLSSSLSIECYDFKPSLQDDMEAADLIISHAGAGTVMECLRLQQQQQQVQTSNKSTETTSRTTSRLVVVINTILMDNHQTELADAMGQRKHLFVVSDPQLLAQDVSTWDALDSFVPVPKEPGDEHDFVRRLTGFLGLAGDDIDDIIHKDDNKEKKKDS